MESFDTTPGNEDGIQISFTAVDATQPLDEARLLEVSRNILTDAGYQSACVSLVVVDDPTIHDLNRRYLDHDYTTDVLSFPLEDRGDYLEGEVVASVETASREAAERGVAPADELMLYLIHGLLHLVGFRDKDAAEAARMRVAESRYLEQAGIAPVPSQSPLAEERAS